MSNSQMVESIDYDVERTSREPRLRYHRKLEHEGNIMDVRVVSSIDIV